MLNLQSIRNSSPSLTSVLLYREPENESGYTLCDFWSYFVAQWFALSPRKTRETNAALDGPGGRHA